MHTMIPIGTAYEACGYSPLIVWALVPDSRSITSPPHTPAKNRIPPIERSIPAVTITNVSPIASRITSEVLRAICSRLLHVRKVPGGVVSQKKATSPSRKKKSHERPSAPRIRSRVEPRLCSGSCGAWPAVLAFSVTAIVTPPGSGVGSAARRSRR